MKNLLYIFTFVFVLVSCASSQVKKVDNTDVVGVWNWESTTGGFANSFNKNPETLGKKVQLTLQKNYEFSFAENDVIISKGTYSLEMKKSIYTNKPERFITLSNDYTHSDIVLSGIIKKINEHTLEISDNNYDGLGSSFSLIK